MLEAEGDETTEDLTYTKARVPDAEARRLFSLGVVLATDDHQRGTNGCLEDSQKDSSDHQCRIVFDGGGGSGDNTPKENICPKPFSSWNLLKKKRCDEVNIGRGRNGTLHTERLLLGTSNTRYAMKNTVAAFEKSLPTRLISSRMPMTPAY